jgi:hypothetical protein
MRTITRIGMMLGLAGALSYGATWRGAKLLNASCFDQDGKVRHLGSMCAPTGATTNFAFETTGGRVYKMDALSNEKAKKAIEDGVVKPNRYGDYRARIMGHRESGRVVMVSSIAQGTRSEH